MGWFSWFRRERKSGKPVATPNVKSAALASDVPALPFPKLEAGSKGGRSQLYSVRVGGSFKGDIRSIQSVLQAERLRMDCKARKVTEGETIELALEALRAMLRNGEITGHAVPISDPVWQGLQLIARHQQMSPAEVFEKLVVEKFAELKLEP